MGGLFSSPSVSSPPPPPPPPPAATPPTQAQASVRQAGANKLSQAAKATGGGTVKTSPEGDLTKPATTTQALLG